MTNETTCYIVVMGVDILDSLGSGCVDITVLNQCVCKHRTTMEQVIIMVMQSFKNQFKKAHFL